MPTFRSLPPSAPIVPGIHLAKVTRAVEKVSERGNPMLVLTLELPPPARQKISSILTFVEASRPVVCAFCRSADLTMPGGADVEIDLRAEDCLHRYLYCKIECDEDGAPRVTRFLERQVALQLNPKLAEIKIQPQAPVALPIVGNNWKGR